MVTIDLTTPPAEPATFLDGLPRRIALTLPELRLAAALGGRRPAPLRRRRGRRPRCPRGPPRPVPRRPPTTRRTPPRWARCTTRPRRCAAAACSPTPASTPAWPARSGCSPPRGSPSTSTWPPPAARSKAWHRQAGGAVATLATCDGIVFELAWFPTDQWPGELARVAVIPDDLDLRDSAVPATSTCRSSSSTRSARRCARAAPTWSPCWWSTTARASSTPTRPLADTGPPPRGRPPHRGPRPAAGAGRRRDRREPPPSSASSSWVLLADGWHASPPRQDDVRPRVDGAPVDARRPATELAPVLAQVTRMSEPDRPATARSEAPPMPRATPTSTTEMLRAGRPLRRRRRRDARPGPPRRRGPRRPRRHRLRRALAGDLRPGRGRHPGRDHRQARAADPLGRARRRRAGGARDRADLPLDRRAAGRGLQDARLASPAARSATSRPRSRSAARSSRPA